MEEDGGDLLPTNQLCDQLGAGLWRVGVQASGHGGGGLKTQQHMFRKREGGPTGSCQGVWPRAGSLGENGCAWLPGPVPSHTNSVSTLLSSCRGPREMKPRLQLSGLCSVVQRRDAATRTDGGVAATPTKVRDEKHEA